MLQPSSIECSAEKCAIHIRNTKPEGCVDCAAGKYDTYAGQCVEACDLCIPGKCSKTIGAT